MIGMVLVTHGRLAEELRSAMEHVVGTQRGVATICIGADDDVEQRRREIRQRIEDVDAGDGVVVITDMFGGTPSNLAISMMDRPNVEVIAGANLPMLVKLAKQNGCTPNLCMLDPRQSNGHHPDAVLEPPPEIAPMLLPVKAQA